MTYKVVETCMVTDVEIERILNEWIGLGYSFSSIQFVSTAASHRPAMAFIFFTRPEEGGPAGTAGGLNT